MKCVYENTVPCRLKTGDSLSIKSSSIIDNSLGIEQKRI